MKIFGIIKDVDARLEAGTVTLHDVAQAMYDAGLTEWVMSDDEVVDMIGGYEDE